jgi:hypothetical protein
VVEAVARGHYATQLGRLLCHFPREQILVLQYERCVAHPAEELARTYAFLGIDPGFIAPGLSTQVYATPGPKIPLDDERRAELCNEYREGVRQLAAEWPQIDLALWPNFADLSG